MYRFLHTNRVPTVDGGVHCLYEDRWCSVMMKILFDPLRPHSPEMASTIFWVTQSQNYVSVAEWWLARRMKILYVSVVFVCVWFRSHTHICSHIRIRHTPHTVTQNAVVWVIVQYACATHGWANERMCVTQCDINVPMGWAIAQSLTEYVPKDVKLANGRVNHQGAYGRPPCWMSELNYQYWCTALWAYIR